MSNYDIFKTQWENIAEKIIGSYDCLCLQINLTKLYNLPIIKQNLSFELEKFNIYGVNTRIKDISKTLLHEHLVNLGLSTLKAHQIGDPNELLFIKTDLNYGGYIEKTIEEHGYSKKALIDSPINNSYGPYSYCIARRDELRAEIWSNESIVIVFYMNINLKILIILNRE